MPTGGVGNVWPGGETLAAEVAVKQEQKQVGGRSLMKHSGGNKMAIDNVPSVCPFKLAEREQNKNENSQSQIETCIRELHGPLAPLIVNGLKQLGATYCWCLCKHRLGAVHISSRQHLSELSSGEIPLASGSDLVRRDRCNESARETRVNGCCYQCLRQFRALRHNHHQQEH